MQIDEEGFPLFSGLRVQDQKFGYDLINGIQRFQDGRTFIIQHQNDRYILEAFDQPFVAQMVSKNQNAWEIELPYGVRKTFKIDSLKVDEWDRFHGQTVNDIPFVMTRKAQNEFFNLVDGFNDDGIFIKNQFYAIPPYWGEHTQERHSQTWSRRYRDADLKPGWDMGGENPILQEIVPKLKLPKSRILVLGCGPGHDAAFFAKRGHIVTAVDFSSEAINEAKKNYADLSNLNFVQADVFQLPESFENKFDIVFEHTLFCAIDPSLRNELVRVYKRCLNEHGNLLGIFFTMDALQGPPFGGTEWEYRERLKKHFQILYWQRWRGGENQNLISKRTLGSELILFSKKVPAAFSTATLFFKNLPEKLKT